MAKGTERVLWRLAYMGRRQASVALLSVWAIGGGLMGQRGVWRRRPYKIVRRPRGGYYIVRRRDGLKIGHSDSRQACREWIKERGRRA